MHSRSGNVATMLEPINITVFLTEKKWFIVQYLLDVFKESGCNQFILATFK